MSNQSLREALAPFAERVARKVHEQEVMRVSATLSSPAVPADALAKARYEVLKWAEKRSGGKLPPEAWLHRTFDYLAGGRTSLGIRIQTNDADVWAIRADDPDKETPGRTWTTEVVLGSTEDDRPRMGLRLLVNTAGSDSAFVPQAPGLLRQLVTTCGLESGELPIRDVPKVIESSSDTDELVDQLLDRARLLPVFVVTIAEGQTAPLLDPARLARAMVGLAHVAVVPAQFAWGLTHRLQKQRSVFGGAVRVYLPGFAMDSNPYEHQLELSDRIRAPGGVERCEHWMRALAARYSLGRQTLGRDILTFATVRSAAAQVEQERLAYVGATVAEQLVAANVRIEALKKQIAESEEYQAYFSEVEKEATERAQVAEEQLRSARRRIQQITQRNIVGGFENPVTLPSSWPDLITWCEVQMAGLLVLTPTARRALRDPEYKSPSVVAKCLDWLARDCRDRLIIDGRIKWDELVVDGIHNCLCGEDAFTITWEGRTFTVDWHIKSGGNTRDPARCLRIYYFWDDETQQFVIADLPAHRRTGAS
jgi:hypothetical protein